MKWGKEAPVVESAAYFDEMAEDYAAWYESHSPGGYALRVRLRRVLELLDQPAGKMLDVGCGPGVLAGEFLARGNEVWGVDASAGMIKQCQQRFRPTDRAHFGVGDATDLAFPDGFFDAVVSTGVVDFIPAYELALSEMVRVVKGNGTLLIAFPNLLCPSAAWSKFVFYPMVALLRPIYYRLAGRPQPPSLPLFRNKLHTPGGATALLARHGAEVTNVAYYHFSPFLAPLDGLFPRWALGTAEKLEGLRRGSLKWLGAGFILKARKR